MAQRWDDLLFAHWPCPEELLRPLLPPSLELDRFDGVTWVGIVPFRMTGVHLRWMPAVPTTGRFAELNVRTYVTDGRKPGVWFFSLDAASPLAVSVGRRWFGLPYFNADMQVSAAGDSVRYSSARTHAGAPPAAFDARYGPAGDVELASPGTLAHWLTERYCLYAADHRGHLRRAEIHHRPWPLQPAWAAISHNTMAEAAGLTLPDTDPILHFARTLDVRIYAPSGRIQTSDSKSSERAQG